MVWFTRMNNIDFNSSTFVGKKCYKIIEDLFPICRSITGPGLRYTLEYIKGIIPKLAIHSIKVCYLDQHLRYIQDIEET